MSEQNKHLELMLQVTRNVLNDAVHVIGKHDQLCATEVAQLQAYSDVDMRYVVDRASKEGTSFFTKHLPLFGKRLDAALLTGEFDSRGFINRAASKDATSNVLFGWLLNRIRPAHDSSEPWVGCPIAVKLLRQLTYLFYKYELPYSHAQEDEVLSAFIHTDQGLPDEDHYDSQPEDPYLDLASRLIARVVHRFDASEIIPKHGPGAVATGEQPWEKMRFARIYKPIEEYFPFTEWMVPSVNWIVDNFDTIQNTDVLEHATAKVVLVPKDSRGPRLISCEPLEVQWIQQGISKQLVELIESSPLTAGRVNFTDQQINRKFALYGSMGTSWVTLDMKEASDRVSLALVRKIFRRTSLLQYLLCSRSAATKLPRTPENSNIPGGNTLTLKKFAPMGSALCFPVEALVFWALGVASLHLDTGLPLSRAVSSVKVYGDDIITTRENCAAVITTYERYHLRVNTSKCCTTGFFRESCGMDAYRGVDVTPIKIRSVISSDPNCNTVVSFVEVSNLFSARGYSETADALEGIVRKMTTRDKTLNRLIRLIPVISDSRPRSFLCFRRSYSTDDYKGLPSRHNPVYQRAEVRALVSQPVSVLRRRPGWELLFKSLIALEHRDGPCKGPTHDRPTGSVNTQFIPLRGRVSLKPRWCLK